MIVQELRMEGRDGAIRQVSPTDVEVMWPAKRPVILLVSGELVVFLDGDDFVFLDSMPLMLLLEEDRQGECWIRPSAIRRIMGGLPTEVIMESGRRFDVDEGAVSLRKRKQDVLALHRMLETVV